MRSRGERDPERQLYGHAARATVRQHHRLRAGEDPLLLPEPGDRRAAGRRYRQQAASTLDQRHPGQYRLRYQHRAAAVPPQQRRRVREVQKRPAGDLAERRVLIYKADIIYRAQVPGGGRPQPPGFASRLNDARDDFTEQIVARNEITVCPLAIKIVSVGAGVLIISTISPRDY